MRFHLWLSDDGTIFLSGRFDASQEAQAKELFGQVTESCAVDFKELTYISSSGLGVLLATQKRLVEAGHGLKLVNLSPHIREIFEIAGFQNVFEIEGQDR